MYKNPYPGIFIVLEGLDGSGQTTQADFLRRRFQEEKISVILTKEPTMDSQAGREIDQVLKKKKRMKSDKLQKLFVQDRKEHLENLIIPGLKNTSFVISDRYFLSTCAFGGINVAMGWLIGLNNEFILPDITFILDVVPKICLKRIDKRGTKREYFETLEKLTKVRQNYLELATRFPNIYVIDGESSKEEVFESILKVFGEWGKGGKI